MSPVKTNPSTARLPELELVPSIAVALLATLPPSWTCLWIKLTICVRNCTKRCQSQSCTVLMNALKFQSLAASQAELQSCVANKEQAASDLDAHMLALEAKCTELAGRSTQLHSNLARKTKIVSNSLTLYTKRN